MTDYVGILFFVIVIAVVLLACFFLGKAIRANRKLIRMIQAQSESTKRFIWSAIWIHNSVTPDVPFRYPNDWAAHPDFLAEIYRLIWQTKPEIIVELGSGTSTIFIAEVLKRRGHGKLISIEHDQKFGNETLKEISERGLDEFVDLRIATIPNLVFQETEARWYDEKVFEDISKFDLLVVDGPPASFGPMVRGHALPALRTKLKIGGALLLDDSNRHGEQQAIELWKKQFPRDRFENIPTSRGATIVWKGS